MAERQLSERSRRRLRLQVAQRLVADREHNPGPTPKKSRHVIGEPQAHVLCGLHETVADSNDGLSREERSSDESLSREGLTCHDDCSDEKELSDDAAELNIGSGDGSDGLDSEVSGSGHGESENDLIEETERELDVGLCGSIRDGSCSESEPSDSEEFTVSSESDGIEGQPERDLGPEMGLSEGVPLFPESRVTSEEFRLAFLSLTQRHNLTYASQTDILKLLTIVLPAPSDVPSSASMLTSKLVRYKTETKIQRFCGCCTCPLDPGFHVRNGSASEHRSSKLCLCKFHSAANLENVLKVHVHVCKIMHEMHVYMDCVLDFSLCA